MRLKPDATPFSPSVPRSIPIPLYKIVRRELSKLERNRVIRRIYRPTAVVFRTCGRLEGFGNTTSFLQLSKSSDITVTQLCSQSWTQL